MNTVNTGKKKNMTKGSLDMVSLSHVPGWLKTFQILLEKLKAILLVVPKKRD